MSTRQAAKSATPKPAAPAGRSPWLLSWRLPLLLCGICLAAYINSFGLGVALDATQLLADPRIQAVTGENVTRIFTGPYWYGNEQAGLFRPLTTLSFLVNYAVLGNGADLAGYHVVNFLLHAANVCLLFCLLRRLFGAEWPAFFGAALWAVHPAGVETVANLSGRADLLSTLAVLGGLLLYARRSNPLWVVVVALPGMFAKESTAALLGLMVLWDLTRGLPEFREDWRRRAAAYAGVAACVAVLFAVRSMQPPMYVPLGDNAMAGADFLTARLTAIKVIGRYLGLLAFPYSLSADYSYSAVPLAHWGDAGALFALALVAAILAAVAVRYRRDRVLFFAAGFFGIALLPASNLLIVIGSIMAERFLYLPSIGFAVAVVALLFRLEDRLRRPRLARTAAWVLIALFAVRTLARNPDWKDDATLWTASLATMPESYKVQKGYAMVLFDRDAAGNLDAVTSHLERALRILEPLPPAAQPPNVMSDLGMCYRMKGDRARGMETEEGRTWYGKSVALLTRARSTDEQAQRRREDLLRARGKDPGALVGDPAIYRNLSNSLLNLKLVPEALESCRAWRRLEPRNPDVYMATAAVHLGGGDQEGAARILLEERLMGVGGADMAPKLRSLYDHLPGGACMFQDSAVGMSLNPGCPRMRTDVCLAAAGIVQVLTEARRKDEAEAQRTDARTRFGCQ